MLYEVACSACGGCVQQVKEHFRLEGEWIARGGSLESTLERRDSDVGEHRVVADEVGQQLIEVPQTVIHRRGGHEDDLLRWITPQERTQGLSTARIGVPGW